MVSYGPRRRPPDRQTRLDVGLSYPSKPRLHVYSILGISTRSLLMQHRPPLILSQEVLQLLGREGQPKAAALLLSSYWFIKTSC